MGKTAELLKLVKYGKKLGRNVFKKILINDIIYVYYVSIRNKLFFDTTTDRYVLFFAGRGGIIRSNTALSAPPTFRPSSAFWSFSRPKA